MNGLGTDLDGGDAEAAGLEHGADAAGGNALAEPAHDAARHHHVLHRRPPSRVYRSWLCVTNRRGTRGGGGGASGLELQSSLCSVGWGWGWGCCGGDSKGLRPEEAGMEWELAEGDEGLNKGFLGTREQISAQNSPSVPTEFNYNQKRNLWLAWALVLRGLAAT